MHVVKFYLAVVNFIFVLSEGFPRGVSLLYAVYVDGYNMPYTEQGGC